VALCDRCLQPIDEAAFQANIARLSAAVEQAACAHRANADRVGATQVRPLAIPHALNLGFIWCEHRPSVPLNGYLPFNPAVFRDRILFCEDEGSVRGVRPVPDGGATGKGAS
jgi:hypothetical protein